MHAQDCTVISEFLYSPIRTLHTAVINVLFLPLVFTLPSSTCSSHECWECQTLTLTSFVCMYTKRRQCSTQTHCSRTYAMYSMWTPEQQGSREHMYRYVHMYIMSRKLGVNSIAFCNLSIWEHLAKLELGTNKVRCFMSMLVFIKAVFYLHCCFVYTSIVWWMN